jgi:hypothetical protein
VPSGGYRGPMSDYDHRDLDDLDELDREEDELHAGLKPDEREESRTQAEPASGDD